MSIKIEIKSDVITEISGISKKSGKPYNIRKQVAWAHTYDEKGQLNPYPERIELNVADGQPPFAAGNYSISPVSFFVGDFNQLAIGRLVLTPIASLRSAAA